MSKITLLAEKYADVLVELAKEEDTLIKWEEELDALVSAFEEESTRNFFYSVVIEPQDKKNVLRNINEKAGFSKEIYNLLRILIDKRNLSLLPYILDYFSTKIDKRIGRKKFTIKTAYPLDEDSKQIIERKIGTYMSNLPKLTYKYEVDESILGGFIADADGLLIDGSTKTHLNKLRKKLLQI